MSARPRVLLVEDDSSLRRFVSMALEELPIELIECADVASALQVLRAGPVRLLITDLMMPGESGLVLIERLAADPQLLGGARMVVFSAGLSEATLQQLAAWGVWRSLRKPVPLAELQACVLDALADAAAGAEPATESGVEAAPGALTGPEDADAVARHFGGDAVLFAAFKADCLQRLVGDVRAADQALASGDAAALRRLAHSLKSVLQLLGHDATSEIARELEDAAAGGRWEAARSGWGRLRTRLLQLAG